MAKLQKIRSTLLTISAYLIPFVQQIPAMGVYVGLMTLPVFFYLIILFSQYPMNFLLVLSQFFLMSFMSVGGLIANILVISGFILIAYSMIYLHRHKSGKLVTTGPYRFIRHPQYTGFLLLTLGLTSLSYWVLATTFGIGWLSKEATVALWFVQLSAYVVLALIEESYLAKEFGNTYTSYKRNVSFLVPFGGIGWFDIPLSIGTMTLLMLSIIWLPFPVSGFFA